MDIICEKKNKIAKDLFTNKYRKRVVKPKKGKGSFKRKKLIQIIYKKNCYIFDQLSLAPII